MGFAPITLTEFGDTLRLDTGSGITEEDLVGTGIIWHNRSCCPLKISRMETHYRVTCKDCGTIVVVPKEVDTYGKLRKWCLDQIEDERQRRCDFATLITQNMRF